MKLLVITIQGLLITTNFYNNFVPDKMMGEWADAPMMFKLIETPQSGACGVTHTSKEARRNSLTLNLDLKQYRVFNLVR